MAPSLVGSVYATFQSGLEAVSNLNLKSDVASIKASDQDDLSPYLPGMFRYFNFKIKLKITKFATISFFEVQECGFRIN